jgi:hypothetical protein
VVITDQQLPAGNLTYRHDGTQEGMFIPGSASGVDNIQYN